MLKHDLAVNPGRLLLKPARGIIVVEVSNYKKLIFKGKVPNQFKMTPARSRVLGALDNLNGIGASISELAKLAKVSPSVISGMILSGYLFTKMEPKDLPYAKVNTAYSLNELSEDQSQVVIDINNLLDQTQNQATNHGKE